MTFHFVPGYYVRRLSNAVLAFIIGLAITWGGFGIGDNLSWLRTIMLVLGFFLLIGGVLGVIGAIAGIFITRRTVLSVENNAIRLLAGKREVIGLAKEDIQGICYDYESLVPTPTGFRYSSAKPTALRLVGQTKVYLLLTSRMYEDEQKRLLTTLTEAGYAVQTPKIGPEIATFPPAKYERGESGFLLFTQSFLLGYKDTASPNPVLREGALHFFSHTENIEQVEPASSVDLPGSSGSGRTAILRLTLRDGATKDISLGFSARANGPDYRKA
jgi:hypothetical protein